jgi:protein ImuB
MYACIHASADPALLVACAQAFSPLVEQTAPDIAVLDVSGLGLIHGAPHEIAAAIDARARLLGFQPHIAIASNPDAAICAARGFTGVSVLPHGDEAKFLESLPLHLLGPGEEMLETFDRWGLRTFRDLAVLPPLGIAGRLGAAGVRLQTLARGELERPLVPLEDPIEFHEEMELDYPVDLLEPLSFVLSRLLSDICGRLARRGLATIEVRLRLALEDKTEHQRTLRLPVPMCDPRTFLKLMQLDLAAHPPAAPVTKVRLDASPAKPRVAQGGLYIATAPEPERLELTLARVAALVGEENVGSPELLDTHRPDAFRMLRFRCTADLQVGGRPPGLPGGNQHDSATGGTWTSRAALEVRRTVMCFRYIRPAREARVQLENGRPVFLLADSIRGPIVSASGPWRTSGDWWTADPWDRDEWDVGLREGALYRIYLAHATGRWFVEGSFD